MISLYDWKNATCDNINLNKATQNYLLLICISHCLLKEDILHCTTMINAIPKIKFIYLRKLLWVSKLLVSFKYFIHPAILTLGPSNMWFTRLLSPKTFIPQTELPYNSMCYLEESIEERSGTLIRRFFKVARTERSSHLWSQLRVTPQDVVSWSQILTRSWLWKAKWLFLLALRSALVPQVLVSTWAEWK